MAVVPTQASKEVELSSADPHKLISLLMAGTLERITQVNRCLDEGNEEDKLVLLNKIVAIIKGLRGSLDFASGGDIAVNLDTLYAYMLFQLRQADDENSERSALVEVERLMNEIKADWDEIDISAVA